MQVKVHAEVVNPKDETRETTNDFYFTFNTRDNDVPSVIPKTYAGKKYLTETCQYHLSCVGGKFVFGFPTRSDINQAVQPKKMARGLK